MESPFNFGKKVYGSYFINREKEIKRLEANFISGINTMIIAPRRWGKSSLVEKVSEVISANYNRIRVIHIDLFKIRNERDFFEQLMTEVIKASSTKWEDWMKNAKNFLKGLVSSFSVGIDPYQEFSFKLNWEQPEVLQTAIADLPEQIALKKKIRLIVCLDEFQKIAEFPESIHLQQMLRSVWQSHKSCTYCLYGSKFHVINELFTNESMPFFNFGDILYLEKIPKEHWYAYITNGFKATGKEIKRNYIDYIIHLSNNHPFHVQQLSHQLWRTCEKSVDDGTFAQALDELLRYNQILYSRIMDNLTELQVNMLAAIASGETQLNSSEVIQKYRLGTSGNVETLKKALIKKDLINFSGEKPEFEDPLFEYWFRKNFARFNS
jgi:hypothetical protein